MEAFVDALIDPDHTGHQQAHQAINHSLHTSSESDRPVPFPLENLSGGSTGRKDTAQDLQEGSTQQMTSHSKALVHVPSPSSTSSRLTWQTPTSTIDTRPVMTQPNGSITYADLGVVKPLWQVTAAQLAAKA